MVTVTQILKGILSTSLPRISHGFPREAAPPPEGGALSSGRTTIDFIRQCELAAAERSASCFVPAEVSK
jgi:hypothetical protein